MNVSCALRLPVIPIMLETESFSPREKQSWSSSWTQCFAGCWKEEKDLANWSLSDAERVKARECLEQARQTSEGHRPSMCFIRQAGVALFSLCLYIMFLLIYANAKKEYVVMMLFYDSLVLRISSPESGRIFNWAPAMRRSRGRRRARANRSP